MVIAGFVKNSFVDYPGKIACAIFTAGCNMDCWYCHNSHIINNCKKVYNEDEILEFLSKRKEFLDAVVVSGGEPTLQKDLMQFLTKIKQMGYLVKLDTNGTNSNILSEVISKNLVDYVAMDIKAPLQKYNLINSNNISLEEVKSSIEILLKSNIEYEFRTTFSPDISLDDLENICKIIKGAKNYYIQKYNNVEYNKKNMKQRPISDYERAKTIAEKFIKNVGIRGLN